MSEIKFTKEHEWILMKDNIGLVGITDFAQKQLGDLFPWNCQVLVMNSSKMTQWQL